ncbi:DUF3618 domain-containing protein [Streptomyces sp. NBC_00233]|uniref:DUF3618 domain-containing protein n=1 Tax=Streptomyces sp. NBC_00233 TaxID=2975686 RepID=UPI00225BEA15|nr:DUF3618 domain-containing protein [Streptomyces sp. NBC_00233]MCX5231278.1 DUF3618 domain-containing protein [Streptomyces sp. NBC_00233]
MSHQPRGDESAPPPEELRKMAAHTREKLGQTVDALAAKTDVKAQTMEKAADLRTHAAAKAAAITGQLRETAEHAAQLAKDKSPDPVVDKAAHAAAQLRGTAARAGQLATERTPDLVADKVGQGAAAARAYRTPLLLGAAALGVLLLVRRSRRHR